MSANKDGLSGYAFYQALTPRSVPGTAVTGNQIDVRGFNTWTFVVNVGAFTSVGAMSVDNTHDLILEHASTSGGTFYAVTSVDMVRPYGDSGAITSGIFKTLTSYTDGSQIYGIGYRGAEQFVQLRLSGVGAPSAVSMAAMAVGGSPENWPVNKVDPDSAVG